MIILTYDICEGKSGLISQAFATSLAPTMIPTDDDPIFFPHTVLKHTIYFHCGNSIDKPVIDSLSWLYDNTRGRMNSYPFTNPLRGGEVLINPTLDVTFRPTFNDFDDDIPYPPNDWIENWSNGYYVSGHTPPGGSVNYFPSDEIHDPEICDSFILYQHSGLSYEGFFRSIHPDIFNSIFVHPPPFALLDAPLLNFDGNRYAGYHTNGSEMDNLKQTYKIDYPFDLRIINPSEKIIYNPSEVSINCDLTFPCLYQFRTLHGKYPDRKELEEAEVYNKTYWDEIPGFNFEYDKDYPIPVNCSVNAECTSTYILGSDVTITFEPNIIIMDALFTGESTTNRAKILYDPDRTYGNWSYDSTKIELVEVSFPEEYCSITPIEKSVENPNNIFNKQESNTKIKVLNSLTKYPKIEVEIEDYRNAILMIYNSSGTLVRQDQIKGESVVVDYSSLEPGIYHVILVNNGQSVDRLSFGKL